MEFKDVTTLENFCIQSIIPVRGSLELSVPVMSRIPSMFNIWDGKPRGLDETSATSFTLSGDSETLCRSIICLAIFQCREDLQLHFGHCQFFLVLTIFEFELL